MLKNYLTNEKSINWVAIFKQILFKITFFVFSGAKIEIMQHLEQNVCAIKLKW